MINAIPNTPSSQSTLTWRLLARCSGAEARERVPFKLAIELKVLPISLVLTGGASEIPSQLETAPLLVLVCARSLSAEECQQLRTISGCEIVVEPGEPSTVEQAVFSAYCGGIEKREGAWSLTDILKLAIAKGASDIHLEPTPQGLSLRLRIHGTLSTVSEPENLDRALIRQIKVRAQMDLTGIPRPADGAFSETFANNTYRFRISIVPHVLGEKVVLRVLYDSLSVESCIANGNLCQQLTVLGATPAQVDLFTQAISSPSGCLVLSGPTGSGKTTLLYTLIAELNQQQLNIVTLEDPIERIIPGVCQIQVSPERGCGFLDLLKYSLRQDPDVIMLGELRDSEAATTALQASVTGHLVLTTCHAGDCLELLLRLDRFVNDRDLLATSLRLLVAQRLIPKQCPHCRIAVNLQPRFAELLRIEQRVWQSQGCSHCERGIVGRLGVFELLPVSSALLELLLPANRAAVDRLTLKKFALSLGYEPYYLRLRELLIQGEISAKEVALMLGYPANPLFSS